MHVSCKSCGKEFNELTEGIRYSSVANGVMLFCSDDCCKDYLNVKKKWDSQKYRELVCGLVILFFLTFSDLWQLNGICTIKREIQQ